MPDQNLVLIIWNMNADNLIILDFWWKLHSIIPSVAFDIHSWNYHRVLPKWFWGKQAWCRRYTLTNMFVALYFSLCCWDLGLCTLQICLIYFGIVPKFSKLTLQMFAQWSTDLTFFRINQWTTHVVFQSTHTVFTHYTVGSRTHNVSENVYTIGSHRKNVKQCRLVCAQRTLYVHGS